MLLSGLHLVILGGSGLANMDRSGHILERVCAINPEYESLRESCQINKS